MITGNKNGKKVLLDDPNIALSIFGQKGFFGIDVLSEDFILFRGEKGELLANRLPYHFVDKGVKGIEFYSDLKRVLVWQKNRIGVLDFLIANFAVFSHSHIIHRYLDILNFYVGI